jgi:hypothetical protein
VRFYSFKKIISQWLEITYSPKSQSDIALNLARSSVKRMIDMVCNVGSKDPVVGAIAEQVTHRHGSMREAMNKQSFQYAFAIVKHPADNCNAVDANRESVK